MGLSALLLSVSYGFQVILILHIHMRTYIETGFNVNKIS